MNIENFSYFIRKLYPTANNEDISLLLTELIEIVEDPSIELCDTYRIVTDFEERIGFSESSEAYYVMSEIISELEDNKSNADRLYAMVTQNVEDLSAINKLLFYNLESLSTEQVKKLISIAKAFDFYNIPDTAEHDLLESIVKNLEE